MSERYHNSENMLLRAQKTIPLGTQTFSKSKTQYPFGVSPFFIQKGQGSHVWDVDGNEYIDFINGLAAVTLGYNDPDVNRAVQEQMAEGIIFSLPHPIEIEVSEKIVEMVPCAEMVRFGKNGSDATAGAVRVARAYTHRDRVAVCGYHGWQDWYIGSTARNLGVPQVTRELTHTFIYNNIGSLEDLFRQWPGQFAAVIMEPIGPEEPQDNFLDKVKELTHAYGAVLIFDETVTGFRFGKGGAQEYLGVIPDLATFGKGLANGYPLSAVVGRADIMRLMEEVFFSFTSGGETLSLAASLATLEKLQREPVIETMRVQGQKIMEGLQELINKNELNQVFFVKGNPVWSFIGFRDTLAYGQWELKTLFLQEMFARGILILATHNMSYTHSDMEIERLLEVYDEVFCLIRDALSNNTLSHYLHCQVLEPLFKVR